MTMYDNIARVHKQIVEAKWRARTAKTSLSVSPNLVVHCEESIAFLAEEVLKVRAMVEDVPEKLEQTVKLVSDIEGLLGTKLKT
jgi:hypothetical protein